MADSLPPLVPSASFVVLRVSATFVSTRLYQGCANALDLQIDFTHLLGGRFPNATYTAVFQLRNEHWTNEDVCAFVPLDSGQERLTARIPFIAPEIEGHTEASVVISANDIDLLTIDLGCLNVEPNRSEDVLEALLDEGDVLCKVQNLSPLLHILTAPPDSPEQVEIADTNVYPVIRKFDSVALREPLRRIVGRAGRELRRRRRITACNVDLREWKEQIDLYPKYLDFDPSAFLDDLREYLALVERQEPMRGRKIPVYVTSYQAVTGPMIDPNVEPTANRLFIFGFSQYLWADHSCAVDLSKLVELSKNDARGVGSLSRLVTTLDLEWNRPVAYSDGPWPTEDPEASPDEILRDLTRRGVFVDSSGRCSDRWIEWGPVFMRTPGPSQAHSLIAIELGRVLAAIAGQLRMTIEVCVSRHHRELTGLVTSAGFSTVESTDERPVNTAVVCLVRFDTQLSDLADDLRDLDSRGANVVCTLSVFSLNAALPAGPGTLIHLALYRFDETSVARRWVDMTTPHAGLNLMPFLSRRETT